MTGVHQSISGSRTVYNTPTIVSTVTATGLSADFSSIPMPSGVLAGRLLIFSVTNPSTVVPGAPSNPTGCTALAQTSGTGGTAQSTFYKVLTGSESGNIICDLTGSAIDWAGWAMIISSRQGNPEISVLAAATTTTPDPPSITPTWGLSNASLIITSLSTDQVSTTNPILSYPTNYINTQNIGAATCNASFGLATRTKFFSVEDPSTFTFTSTTRYVAHTIAVRSS